MVILMYIVNGFFIWCRSEMVYKRLVTTFLLKTYWNTIQAKTRLQAVLNQNKGIAFVCRSSHELQTRRNQIQVFDGFS